MSIHLHTGIPGHGKTLFTLWYVRKWAEGEGRKVYYYGIPDLQIPEWEELADPKEWASVPPKSIVLIDESQKVFPRRSSNGAVPAHVSGFETHRHLGIDIVLITQHPSLIDRHIHPLTDKHRHVIRAFGANYATVHEWPQVMAQCEKPGSRKDSVKTQFPYPKEVFTWYKSAEAHTYKAKIPGKVWLGLFLPVLLAAAVWFVYDWAQSRIHKPGVEPEAAHKLAPGQKAVPGQGGLGGGAGGRKDKMTVAEWVEDQTPRMPGLPHTAPMYDQVTQPVQAPYPAACIQMASKGCRCYSPQGTLLQVDNEICVQIVANGFFIPWQAAGGAPGAGPVKPGAVPVSRPMREASPAATMASVDSGVM